ncbi:MAG: hypothetical protein ACLPVY_27655 [Acidimicrobiia bacterium]
MLALREARGDTQGDTRRWSGKWDRSLVWVVAGLVAVPVFVLLVRVLHSGWLSSSDWAAIELRTRDVGTPHTPLVGPYSRYGWNHPGPLLFYVLAVPYRILGSQGRGILAGALAVNAAAIGLVGVVLWRRGRVAGLTLGLLVVLLLARALGTGFLVDPWNPYVIVLPLFAVVCLAWAATDGDLWAFPAAVGVGSFVVQSHVGVTLAVLAAIGVAAVIVVVDARRDGFAQLKTVAVVSLAVAFACWLPPLLQQLEHEPGNLGELTHFFLRPHATVTGWSTGARIVGQQLSIPAPWFTGHESVNAFTDGVDPHWHVPIALILLIGAGLVARRRHDRQSLTLDALALAVVFAAVFSAAHIVDTPYNYIVRWMWTVGALVWLAIVWTAWRALPVGIRRGRTASRLSAALIAVLAAWLAVTAIHATFPDQADQASLVGIAPAVRRSLRELRGPVLLQAPLDFLSGQVAEGILLIAIHAGVDARLPDRSANAVGSAHTSSETSARSIVVVAVDESIDSYLNNPAYRSLAHYDPLSAKERAYHTMFDIQERDALSSANADPEAWLAAHQADLSRIHELDTRGPDIELFLKTTENDRPRQTSSAPPRIQDGGTGWGAPDLSATDVDGNEARCLRGGHGCGDCRSSCSAASVIPPVTVVASPPPSRARRYWASRWRAS